MSYFRIFLLSCKLVQLAALTVGSWFNDYLKPQIARILTNLFEKYLVEIWIVTNEYTAFNCSSFSLQKKCRQINQNRLQYAFLIKNRKTNTNFVGKINFILYFWTVKIYITPDKKQSMKENDLRLLLSIDDRVIAEDIQATLEEYEIYTMLVSDNPASSVLGSYTGLNPIETVEIQINKDDYQRAVEILNNSDFKELLD